MATSQKGIENCLTCAKCHEMFDKPCTLVCNHTFCRKCVVNYTKTRPEAIRAKSLLCPFCNKMTKVSAPERPVEEWADDVKHSFVIQGLLDSFGPDSTDSTNCGYCREEGETTQTVVWCSVCDDAMCERCARMHKRNPASRNHELHNLSGEVKVTRQRKVICHEHQNEYLEAFCKDCNIAICHKCCTFYHRRCASIVSIESEIPAMKRELSKKKRGLQNRQNETNSQLPKQKVKVNKETVRYSQTEADIKTASVELIQQIKLKERKLLDELKEMSDKHLGQLKADIKSGEMSVQMYQQQAELIDQALQSECDMDVYEMYQGCEAVRDADLKERGRIVKVIFRQDRSQHNSLLGVLDVMYEDVLGLNTTHELHDSMDVRLSDSESAAGPTDVAVLVVNSEDTVVVTDYDNNSVKSFFTTKSLPHHGVLDLHSGPWGLTVLTQTRVAVTVPDTKQIVTVDVNPDLVLLSTITTSKQYMGITALTPSTLAVGARSPPCIDILDMTGNVLTSISPLHNGRDILKYPTFLCTTRTGNILVSDGESNSVMCLSPGGDVVFNYRPTGDAAMGWPCGITSTSTGDILVTDNLQRRVLHLTETGQFVRDILTLQDGAEDPYGVCVDGSVRIYVCLRNTGFINTFKNIN
ncbi:protein wech-like [Haliotis cracherodii]|uniref:protein wech-like n=1 Tax=Haliotis cracherodii TaxID=6455 RepID=UPI0039EA9288